MIMDLRVTDVTPFISTACLATALHARAYRLRRRVWLKWHLEKKGYVSYVMAYVQCLKWEMGASQSRLPLELFR